MVSRPSQPNQWAWFSPWMIIGSVGILAAILFFLAAKNINREREFMLRALLSEANLLANSLEASSRTGMMGMGWGQNQLQLLLEETAQQPEILSAAIVTATGRIVAHNEAYKIGQRMLVNIPQGDQISYRFLDTPEKSFEVVRSYKPWFKKRGRGSHGMNCPFPQEEGACGNDDFYVVLGLDPSPFEAVQRQDLQQTVLLFGLMFLVGAAGIISLVWAQHYRDARKCLRDVEAFTSTLVNQMPVGLMATDKRGQIQRTNAAALQILKSPLINANIYAFPCFRSIAKQLENEEKVVEQDVLYSTDGTNRVPLLVNAAVIRDGEERISGYVFLFTDMTNIKQLEEQLHRSERLAALGRLAAGVAHEIRNPLSSIKGFATILGGRLKDDDRARKIAEVMSQEVERLNRVVSELLDFARPTELQKRVCLCSELIQHTSRLVEMDASHQGVEVQSLINPEDLQVEVDPDRFSQVLLNLYLNALQSMENGGTLQIRVYREADQAVFKISDSGMGISSEDLPHIFDPYYTTKPRGVGLGLANVHKLMEAHGGDIEVESVPGKETSFTLWLPAIRKEFIPKGNQSFQENRRK